MRLIVTRPREDAWPLSRRLTAAGHQVIVAPLLDIRPVADLTIPERRYQAVLMTSANGARALAGRGDIEHLKAQPAVVVGPASAEAAGRAGFARIDEADGDVAALARSVIAKLRPADGPLLYLSGALTAGQLASQLEASGFEVDHLVAYEARPVEELPGECAAALADGKADGVLIYSPRTARIWAALVGASHLVPAALQLVHYCLSDNVATAVRSGLAAKVAVAVAARPDEAALLEMLATSR